jgi:hypothetical protein
MSAARAQLREVRGGQRSTSPLVGWKKVQISRLNLLLRANGPVRAVSLIGTAISLRRQSADCF